MSSLGWREVAFLLLLGAYAGARGAWSWQANHYEKELVDQASAYTIERELAATAVLDWQEAEQARRRALEDRLQANDQTHYQELRDAQQTQARMRDRLATADLRLSVLLAAPAQGSGCGMPAATGSGGVVHGALRADLDPAHARRIVSITDYGDQGLIALKACQAYVRAIAQ